MGACTRAWGGRVCVQGVGGNRGKGGGQLKEAALQHVLVKGDGE